MTEKEPSHPIYDDMEDQYTSISETNPMHLAIFGISMFAIGVLLGYIL